MRLVAIEGPVLRVAELDVLDELGPLVEAAPQPDGRVVHHPAELLLNELEQQVLAAIQSEATPIDRIVSDTGWSVM